MRWIAWEELYQSPANILSKDFLRAYTLGLYRKWLQEHLRDTELEELCDRMIEFGKVLAGPQDDLFSPLIELVLDPGIQFWGFSTESSENVVVAKVRSLVNEMPLLRLSTLTNVCPCVASQIAGTSPFNRPRPPPHRCTRSNLPKFYW